MLNQKEIAKKLGVSEATVSRWVKARLIPYFSLNGLVRFDESVVNEWLQKRKVKTKQAV